MGLSLLKLWSKDLAGNNPATTSCMARGRQMKNNTDNTISKSRHEDTAGGKNVCACNLTPELAIREHLRLLGHSGFGATQLLAFGGVPMVAYIDNEEDAVRLCLQMEGKKTGTYIGVQPRPLHLFERTPNCWQPAHAQPCSNCACDDDIEYITACFFDIDVVSAQRQLGHPASEEELQYSLQAAQLLCRENGLALSSTICCSGNGHYVLAPILPIPVDCEQEAAKFRIFCQQLADKTAKQVTGAKLDQVFNLSRVMRIMGTCNCKGTPTAGRPHRRACFVTEPVFARSVALHHMIVNADVPDPYMEKTVPAGTIKADLTKLEECEFIRFCREKPAMLSEDQWWGGIITNLAPLEGGTQLIHEISRLDPARYDFQKTQEVIERVRQKGYRPMRCERLVNKTTKRDGYGYFVCSQIGSCPARAPMYRAVLRTVYRR